MGHNQSGHPAENPVSNSALLIRADANTQIGSGHVMRCLALAQVWQEQGGGVTFMANVPDALRARLTDEGMAVYSLSREAGSADDAQQLIALARQLNTRYVVVDGYQFGAVYQRQIKEAGLRLLVLDDNGEAQHYHADLVLNQNIHASKTLYASREPYTYLLLGTRYALLRREFWVWRGWQRAIPDVARKVLVTMGGSDPDNVTLFVLRALELVTFANLHVKLVVGGSNPHYDTLQATAQQSPHRIELARNVSDMPTLMAWADVAISAGGSTCWELMFMGLPSAIIVLAENQRAVSEQLAAQNAAVTLGWHADLTAETMAIRLTSLLMNAEQRRAMAVQSRELVDSYGGERVVKALRGLSLNLRPFGPQDRELLWRWANDPTVRQSAFSFKPITWEEHVRWFDQKLGDKDTVIFIVEQEAGDAVGQVRFQIHDHDAEISVSVDAEFRGRGCGRSMLWQALDAISDIRDLTRVNAYIRPENAVSRSLFERVGFHKIGMTVCNGKPAIHMAMSMTDSVRQVDPEDD